MRLQEELCQPVRDFSRGELRQRVELENVDDYGAAGNWGSGFFIREKVILSLVSRGHKREIHCSLIFIFILLYLLIKQSIQSAEVLLFRFKRIIKLNNNITRLNKYQLIIKSLITF